MSFASYFLTLLTTLVIFGSLNASLGPFNNTNAIQQRGVPQIDPHAIFGKTEVAQLKQGIKDACSIAVNARAFAQVGQC